VTREGSELVALGDALHAAAALLSSAGAAIGETGSHVRRIAAEELAGDSWLGAAADAAHRSHAKQATGIDQMAAAARHAAKIVDRLGTTMTEAGRREAAVIAQALALGWRLEGGHLWPVDPAHPPVFGIELPARLAAARVQQHEDEQAAATALRTVAGDLRQLTRGWGPADLVDPVQAALLGSVGALGSVTPTTAAVVDRMRALIAGRDPVAIRAYTDSLAPAARDALVNGHPDLVGPIDGIPPPMRYAANRKLVIRARDAAARRGDDAMVARLARWLADQSRQFLLVDIPGGRIAEVIGNLDTAGHVAVVVPGIRNDLTNFDGLTSDAVNLFRQASAMASRGVATISWLGYNPPGLPAAPFDEIAKAAALRLRDFVAGLVLRKGVTISVVAHSYGTLLTGYALRHGLLVDSVVALGSPGMGAQTAADLHIPTGTRFYAARAPGDPVGWSENFGRDPADPRFGATRIATGQHDGGGPIGHTSYFSGASECTRNLARIISGRYPEVTKSDEDKLERVVDSLDVPSKLTDLTVGGVLAVSQAAAHLPGVSGQLAGAAGEEEARLLHFLGRIQDPDLYLDVANDLSGIEEEHWLGASAPSPR